MLLAFFIRFFRKLLSLRVKLININIVLLLAKCSRRWCVVNKSVFFNYVAITLKNQCEEKGACNINYAFTYENYKIENKTREKSTTKPRLNRYWLKPSAKVMKSYIQWALFHCIKFKPKLLRSTRTFSRSRDLVAQCGMHLHQVMFYAFNFFSDLTGKLSSELYFSSILRKFSICKT